MEGRMPVFTSCTANSSATSTSVTFAWRTQFPDDGPPAGVPARPKPAPGAPPAAVLVPA